MTNKEETCKDRVADHLKSRITDLKKLWANYQEDIGDEELGRFEDYGLYFDYVARGTFSDQEEPFFRYQISTGGPGDEFRFFTGPDFELNRIEYWFLDWFDGASINLNGSDLELMSEIFDFFKEIGSVQAEFEKSKE